MSARPRRVSALKPSFAWRRAAHRIAAVLLFAIGMANVESAAVLYLRTLSGGVDPVGPRSTPFDPLPSFLWVEIGREAATMVMLLAVGWLAGRGFAGRFGGFVAAFGMWDIFYYVFLWLFAGWPASPLAPDILFLIPLPWWGPVISPMLIATLMVVGGCALIAREEGDGVPRPTPTTWALLVAGTLVCLLAFMLPAIRELPNGLVAAFSVRNPPFPWPIYLVGLVLGTMGVFGAVTQPQD